MEDFRLQAVGGMAGAIDVWEMGICTKLLANCGSWVGVGKPALRQLNQLQDSYLRMVYSCPPSTPIPSLQALAGVWDIEHKIALEKVCLITTILHCRSEKNYVKELLIEDILHGWVGITKEVQDICKEMGLPDATKEYISREKAKDAIELHNHSTVKKDMEGKTKCDQIYNQDLRKRQAFMTDKSFENSRMEVLWLTSMIDTRTTMKGKYKQYSSPHCSEGMNEKVLKNPQHLLQCQAYQDLRLGINPEDNQKDRPSYLQKSRIRETPNLSTDADHRTNIYI